LTAKVNEELQRSSPSTRAAMVNCQYQYRRIEHDKMRLFRPYVLLIHCFCLPEFYSAFYCCSWLHYLAVVGEKWWELWINFAGDFGGVILHTLCDGWWDYSVYIWYCSQL